MLFIFGGLPGTGKTTIAKKLSKKLRAIHLRIDSIEQTIVRSGKMKMPEIEGLGYSIAQSVAIDNLNSGLSVIADSVNPLKITRDDWMNVAIKTGKPFLEIEFICSDTKEHKNRVENRIIDIPDLVLPTWQQVIDRIYEPWEREHLTIDTAKISSKEAVEMIIRAAV